MAERPKHKDAQPKVKYAMTQSLAHKSTYLEDLSAAKVSIAPADHEEIAPAACFQVITVSVHLYLCHSFLTMPTACFPVMEESMHMYIDVDAVHVHACSTSMPAPNPDNPSPHVTLDTCIAVRYGCASR